MKFGPFNIQISDQALIQDFDSLTETEQKSLANGIKYDGNKHIIYKISIVPFRDENHNYKGKTLRQKSLESVDSCFISMIFPNKPYLIGVAPPVTPGRKDYAAQNGSFMFELDFSIQGGINLKIQGNPKNLFRKKEQLIISQCVHPRAEWAYAKPFIQSEFRFDVMLMCEKAEQEKQVLCRVTMKDRGRYVNGAKGEVRLPAV